MVGIKKDSQLGECADRYRAGALLQLQDCRGRRVTA